MEYELKKPLQVYVKTEETGQYEPHKTIKVEFVGRSGLKSIKNLQDGIFRMFANQSKSNTGQTVEVKKQDAESKVTVEEIANLLEMTGDSETLFDAVMEKLQTFATIADSNLNLELQDQMSMDDLDGLYQAVLKHFLLPKITLKMNSMNK